MTSCDLYDLLLQLAIFQYVSKVIMGTPYTVTDDMMEEMKVCAHPLTAHHDQ